MDRRFELLNVNDLSTYEGELLNRGPSLGVRNMAKTIGGVSKVKTIGALTRHLWTDWRSSRLRRECIACLSYESLKR